MKKVECYFQTSAAKRERGSQKNFFLVLNYECNLQQKIKDLTNVQKEKCTEKNYGLSFFFVGYIHGKFTLKLKRKFSWERKIFKKC